MKKNILILFLLICPLAVSFSQTKVDSQKIIKDVKEINDRADSAIILGKEYVKLLSKQSHKIGLKRMIQSNSNVFVPIVVFGILYLVWLKGRTKK